MTDMSCELMSGLVEYAERFAELANEPEGGECRELVHRARTFLERSPGSTEAASTSNLRDALSVLAQRGLTFADCVRAYAAAEDDPYVVAARRDAKDGELEVDDTTVVSRGENPGAYVMTWQWVSNEDAGLFSCHSEMLEDMLEQAAASFQAMQDMDPDLRRLTQCQLAWLEDAIVQFAEVIDNLTGGRTSDEGRPTPGEVTWCAEDGKVVEFAPSAALRELLRLASEAGWPSHACAQMESYIEEFGGTWDASIKIGLVDN